MSIAIVGTKLHRRIARETGLDIVRAWGWGGYDFEFVTPDHRHGTWNKPSGRWSWEWSGWHPTSCRRLFPAAQERPTP